jgi:hypothetical protein
VVAVGGFLKDTGGGISEILFVPSIPFALSTFCLTKFRPNSLGKESAVKFDSYRVRFKKMILGAQCVGAQRFAKQNCPFLN